MNASVLVVASTTRACQLCHGDGDVVYAPIGRPELAARVRCLHCGPLRLPLRLFVPVRRALLEAR